MRYVAAALLNALGGGEVSQKTIKNLLDAVGIDCDDEKAKIVVEQLKGKSIEDLLAEGTLINLISRIFFKKVRAKKNS